MGIVPTTRYTADIVPEKESNLETFKLEIESRWVRAKKQHSESGFVIVLPPGSKEAEDLKNYLAYLEKNKEPLDNSS
jgi:hypothetical protein